MITLEALRMFCAVVELGGFHAAAQRLHRSQPAVSQQIKSLERELGAPLLERKPCRPTTAGRIVYQRATRLLSDMDSLCHEVRDLAGGGAGELRIGASDTTAMYVLPPLLGKLRKAMPGTRLVVVSRSSAELERQIIEGDLDIALVTAPKERPEFDGLGLFEYRFVLVTPRQHPLASRKNVRPKDLAGIPYIMLDPQTRTGALLASHFSAQGFDPRVVADSGSFEVIKRYVAEGLGVSFLPELAVSPAGGRIGIVHAPGFPKVSIGAIWRRGRYQTAAESLLLRLLQEHGQSANSRT